MTKEEYQQWVVKMWYSHKPAPGKDYDLRDMYIMTSGLGGEAGEVLEVLKKKERDGIFDPLDLTLELGDLLYNLTMIAAAHNINLEDVMYHNVRKIEKRRAKKEKEVA